MKLKIIFGIIVIITIYSCTQSNEYTVGDRGPAGGIIFYDDKLGFDLDEDGIITNKEKNLIRGSRYLEVAPSGWSGNKNDPLVSWGDLGLELSDPTHESGTIGNGLKESELIIKNDSSGTANAVKLCYNLIFGEYSDWFLPSDGELQVLFNQQKLLEGFVDEEYWSSYEVNKDNALSVFKPNHGLYSYPKEKKCRIRPIRSF